MHVLDVTATALVRLLVIAAILAVPVLLAVAWRSGRRWRLVVAEMVNSTGDSGLNDVTAGLTQLARERIDIENPRGLQTARPADRGAVWARAVARWPRRRRRGGR